MQENPPYVCCIASDAENRVACAAAKTSAALFRHPGLETAWRLRDPGLEYLKTDPLLDPLRKEPRFQAIERELKFPD
jgi:hypothetical protein